MINNMKTAEELMRARYKAFETGDIDFLVETQDEDTRDTLDVEETRKWAVESKWLGLEILSTEAGQENDQEGVVEFKATYEEKGNVVVHHEKSKFVKKDGVWYYHNWLPMQGTIVKDERVGRNDPCTCGSGKKYKKCCGK